jgi:hypothetical protein
VWYPIIIVKTITSSESSSKVVKVVRHTLPTGLPGRIKLPYEPSIQMNTQVESLWHLLNFPPLAGFPTYNRQTPFVDPQQETKSMTSLGQWSIVAQTQKPWPSGGFWETTEVFL